MLSPQENELVTHVGPGTPMGQVMRRYWMPALLSNELPEPGWYAGTRETARRASGGIPSHGRQRWAAR